MAGSMRCSLHSIDYPPHMKRCLVPGCTETMRQFSNDFDENWREQLAYQTKVAEGILSANLPPKDAASDASPRKIVDPVDFALWGADALPDVQVNVARYAGQSWISHEDLTKAGYLFLEDFSVVKIRGRYYELQAHVGRASLTHGIAGGAWWLGEMDPDKFEVTDDLIHSELIRGGELHGEEDSYSDGAEDPRES